MTATQGMTDDYNEHSQYQRAAADTGAARAHDPQRAVVAVHNDLPTNDWTLTVVLART